MGFGKFLKGLLRSGRAAEADKSAPVIDRESPPDLADAESDFLSVETLPAEQLASAKQMHRDGLVDKAEKIYREILHKYPGNADARHMLGLVSMQRGELSDAEAELKEAIALDNQQADYHSNLGNVLVAREQFADALASFQKAISLDPRHIAALGNSATLLLTLGRPGEAEDIARELVQLAPDDTNALLNLAAALMDQNKVRDAVKVLRSGVKQYPHDVDLLVQLASALELLNKLDEALVIVRNLEEQAPTLPKVALIAGIVLRRKGDLELAEPYLRRALKAGLSKGEQVEAYNQLGLILDVQGAAAAAYEAFGESNQLVAEDVDTGHADGNRFLAEVVDSLSFFREEKSQILLQAKSNANEFEPVFFVGFPRSGTTLMEQILKQHPQLVTTDEISPLASVVGQLRKTANGYPGSLVTNSEEDWAQLRRYFQDLCRDRLGDLNGKRLVDKLPLNLVHLGLANILFPKAKIVVALRDPRDVCLSCYMQKFQINDAMVNFLDINSTARTYSAVMELWLQYREILQIPWMEYRYEDLVADFELTVRNLLEFIGVAWDDSIFDYRDRVLQSEVTTPSYRDVTAPINDHAVARWHKYKKELASVLPTLAPYAEKFGYDPA